jgi:uncharacterized low-complexity protein
MRAVFEQFRATAVLILTVGMLLAAAGLAHAESPSGALTRDIAAATDHHTVASVAGNHSAEADGECARGRCAMYVPDCHPHMAGSGSCATVLVAEEQGLPALDLAQQKLGFSSAQALLGAAPQTDPRPPRRPA